MATPTNLPSYGMIPSTLMVKLTYEDKVLDERISTIIKHLAQENFTEALNELNQLDKRSKRSNLLTFKFSPKLS